MIPILACLLLSLTLLSHGFTRWSFLSSRLNCWVPFSSKRDFYNYIT
jgi:hypothetical protein